MITLCSRLYRFPQPLELLLFAQTTAGECAQDSPTCPPNYIGPVITLPLVVSLSLLMVPSPLHCSPQHYCAARADNKCQVPLDHEEKVIPCRRCPRAYHQECIPKKLFSIGRGKNKGQRVWIAAADAKTKKGGIDTPPSCFLLAVGGCMGGAQKPEPYPVEPLPGPIFPPVTYA